MIALLLTAVSVFATGDGIADQLKTCAKSAISAPAEMTKSLKCSEKKAFAAKVTSNAKTPAEKDLAKEIVREANACEKVVARLSKPVDRAKLCNCLKSEIDRASSMAGATGVRLDTTAMVQTAQIKCVLAD